MKKLIIALVAITAAIGVKAAAVDWSAVINGATSSGINLSNYTAYFIDNATWSTVWSEDAGTAGKLQSSALTSALGSAGFAVNGTKGDTGTQSFTTSAASIEYKILIVNNTDDTWAILGSGTATSYDPQSSSGVLAGVTTTGARVLGTASSGNLTWGTVSVPEPTSGLLVLLGIAGLALKRKHA